MQPHPALWLPENVVEPIKMIAIQNRLNQCHREDRERKEERNRDFEFEAHFDPTEPEKQKIDKEEPPLPRSSRPSMDE
ncbi:hypothetical protein DSO57_1027728 [Entomophthora muscae]|uniref:Uncharacterized protein n=1 Tax=Entomophthora muscae TaxID=34485 RepID=A0ACC2SR06_9FUNG|nr:hypothetical protein DSO57_1027728 [Entomophthora muscae]